MSEKGETINQRKAICAQIGIVCMASFPVYAGIGKACEITAACFNPNICITAFAKKHKASRVIACINDCSPFQVSPFQVSPLQVSPLQVSPLQVSPLQVSPSQVSPLQVSPSQASLSQVSPLQVSPLQVSLLQVSLLQVSLLQVSLLQTIPICAQIAFLCI